MAPSSTAVGECSAKSSMRAYSGSSMPVELLPASPRSRRREGLPGVPERSSGGEMRPDNGARSVNEPSARDRLSAERGRCRS